jgi:beta-galactosidase
VPESSLLANRKSFLAAAFVLGLLAQSLTSATHAAEPADLSRRVIPFNSHWQFLKGDPPDAAIPEFDDSDWRLLDLPHDWGIEGPFDQNAPGETAKLPYSGVGWYRKHFTIANDERSRRFYLDVDGAMSYANVWINGDYVGGWPYGYSSWRVDLTPHVHFDGENVIAVRLDNPPKSSRWYPGGGIYRNVWLVKTGPVHVAHWGTQITTRQVAADAAIVEIQVTVDNHSAEAAPLGVSANIYPVAPDGARSPAPVAAAEPASIVVVAGANATAKLSAHITKPKLWSPDHPRLYTAVVTLSRAGQAVDRYETGFGIRTIKFTPDKGLLLNGELTEIRGVCMHHDLGPLGAAFNLRARERQLQKLKELGCNAIRTAHNPPAPELLDLCDRMGFLVMDEAFDAWRMAKRENDYHLLFDDWHERDLRAMIRRDRNHPSVILWSLGNEVYEQRDGKNAQRGP